MCCEITWTTLIFDILQQDKEYRLIAKAHMWQLHTLNNTNEVIMIMEITIEYGYYSIA